MMLKKASILLDIAICIFFFATTVNAQTYTVKTVPTDEYSELFKISNRVL